MDERPLKLLARAPDTVRPALEGLANAAGQLAADAGTDLQFEFGKEHVAFIVGCNQFLRLHFRGDHAGTVEVPPSAGLDGEPALSQVFRMFQWAAVTADALDPAALAKAFDAARTKGQPKL